MAAQSTRITVGLRISSRAKALKNAGVIAAYDIAEELAELAADYARENVREGVGPASHGFTGDKWGHEWPHEDTGDLAYDVNVAYTHQGFLGNAAVYTDQEYGAWLEVGFHSRWGNFFRYQWLEPAFRRAAQEMASQIPTKLFRRLTEQYNNRNVVATHDEISQYIKKQELEHFKYTEEP